MQKLSMPLWILGAWALLTFSAISNGYLLPIDETRYVGVAPEMQQRGDPLVPQLNGEPYSHKPPMLFWAMQGGWAVFGVSAWWPRLVVSLFSIAAAVLTWQLMRRLWPDRKLATQLAPIILFGSLQWAAWTPIVMFDIVLTFWTLIAVAGVAIAGLQRPHIGWTITALGLGFSVLTKGPVALIFVVPLAVCAPLWHPGDIAKSHWYAGFVLSLTGATMIAMAWAWPAAVRGGSEYASAIFWSQSAGRMVNSFAHQRPIWWYLPLLFVLFFPWSCWATTWRALRNLLKEGERATRFLLCWALPPFLFLSFISGKQAHYLVPLAPPLAMLLARALDCWPTSACLGLAIPTSTRSASSVARRTQLCSTSVCENPGTARVDRCHTFMGSCWTARFRHFDAMAISASANHSDGLRYRKRSTRRSRRVRIHASGAALVRPVKRGGDPRQRSGTRPSHCAPG